MSAGSTMRQGAADAINTVKTVAGDAGDYGLRMAKGLFGYGK